LFVNGDIRAAQEQQYKINRVVTLIIKYGVIRSIKYILTLLGVDSGEAVFPGTPLTENEKASLKQELTDIGYFF
jgi:dihydrodipicolinate synthase/N-acetylneuraminate lyase